MQADDFGSEVIPGAKDMGMHIQAYLYDGYWEDIGTVEAFYEANLALTDEPIPKFRCAPQHLWNLLLSAKLSYLCGNNISFCIESIFEGMLA